MIDYREDAKWTVYIHIIPKELSGYEWDKYYVGITSRNPKTRWDNGHGYRGQYFGNAIKKYGWRNIKHEIIAERLTKNEACSLEIKLIEVLNTTNKLYGYNITGGGQGTTGRLLSEESKRLISIKNTGKKRTAEQIQNIKNSRPDISFDKNPNAKEIYQFSINGVFINKFLSLAEAKCKTKLKRAGISHAALHNGTCGGFLWVYDDNIEQENGEYTIKNMNYQKFGFQFEKQLFQFDKQGNFIKRYSSFKEAEKETGIHRSTISRQIHKRSNIDSRTKYIWKLIDDVKESGDNPGSFLIKE